MPIQWLARQEAEDFLCANHVGRLATVGPDGCPYITPLNYAFAGGHIYFHGKAGGVKMENIARNPRVCFEVSRVDREVWQGDKPCGCATRYTSVLVFGRARLIDDAGEKARVLNLLLENHAAGRDYQRVDGQMAARCGVVAVEAERLCGKRNVNPPV